MPNHMPKPTRDQASISKKESGPITASDLVEIVLTPIAEQVNLAKLDILEKFQELGERISSVAQSINIMARQVKRELNQQEADTGKLD